MHAGARERAAAVAASIQFIDRRNKAHLSTGRGPFINEGKKPVPLPSMGNNGKEGLKFGMGSLAANICGVFALDQGTIHMTLRRVCAQRDLPETIGAKEH